MKFFVFDDPDILSGTGIRFYPKIKAGQKVKNRKTKFERLSQHSPQGFMPLGAYSYTQSVFHVDRIGRYCSIATNVSVMGNTHPHTWVTTSPITYKERRRKFWGVQGENRGLTFNETVPPVTIGHDVWIGQNVLLKSGISIGDGAVVAAGAVVTKDVEPYAIIGGNPAAVIRRRFSDEIVSDLVELQWWRYKYDCLQHLDFSEPQMFIDEFPEAEHLEELAEERLNIDGHLNQKLISDQLVS
ncbi:CatB-related O-acetyltransferase [Parasedimentitalea denitrificans]|uniref:CatB-related O-acetyltransferase n=1 Tax=Parasedimentitalea denitrificans TaxID=2211118 RepID=UPI0014300606